MAEHFSNELARALKREDAAELRAAVEAYHRDWEAVRCAASPETGTGPEYRWLWHVSDQPEKVLAFVALAASLSNSAGFLFYVAAGPLEELLRSASDEIIERIVAEARRTPRFRWMLTGVFPHALPERAWQKVAPLLHGVSEEDPMPPAPWA